MKKSYLRERLAPICLLVLTMLAAACSDGTGPAGAGASVQIMLGFLPYDEQTLEIGETLQLLADVLNEAGDPLQNQRVDWRSTAPSVASVSAGGMVTANSVGTARIIASHPAGEDTAVVNVAEGFLAGELPNCEPGDILELAIGEAAVVSGEGALPFCLSGGDAGEAEYTMIAANTASSASSVLQLLIHGEGEFRPGPITNRHAVVERTGDRPRPDDEFHRRLRGVASARLEPLLRAGIAPGAFAGPSRQLAEGQTITFNANSSSGDGCVNPDYRGGRIRYVGQHGVAVADTLNPSEGFTDDDYQEFIQFFDQEVWPLITGNFGEPSDVDGNDKVFVFFTRAVNELVENTPGRSSYVGGFFFNRDLFPRDRCAGSNAAEMFYMLVPDPRGEAGGRSFSHSFVSRSTRSVLVHEFQHLVNDSRRLHVNNAQVWEDTWLSEALSHVAEELMFYRQSGMEPRQNIGPTALAQSEQARDAFRLFQIDNMERLRSFLEAPDSNSPLGAANDLATRGAAWSLLRFAADHRGGDDSAFWHALVRDTRTAGLANLEAALGSDPMPLFSDWAAALYIDDTEAGGDPEYQLQSWNFRALFPAAGSLGLGTTNREYPLDVWALQRGQPRTLQLRGGGAAYTQLTVSGGQVVTIRYLLGMVPPYLPPPSRLQVVVYRSG